MPLPGAAVLHRGHLQLCLENQDSRSHPSRAVVSATDMIASLSIIGVRGMRLMQGLFGALAKPTFGDKACPHCNNYYHLCLIPVCKISHQLQLILDTIVRWLEDKDFNNLFELAPMQSNKGTSIGVVLGDSQNPFSNLSLNRFKDMEVGFREYLHLASIKHATNGPKRLRPVRGFNRP